jgi:PTS system mannose-specific IIB component
MVGILLATHGDFAEGIKMSGSMLFGDQPNAAAVTLQPSDGPDDLRKRMEEAIATFDDPEQVLILVDLWGGTPFNQSNNLIAGHEDTWAIVAGLNLPMLIDAYASRMTMESAQEIAKQIVGSGKEGVRVYPTELEPQEAAPQAAAAATSAPTGAIPPGTVLGDGKIKIALARIDTRLLHGQVATGWTKAVGPDRIIAVSDGVAHDNLRKRMIMEAAPPGVKAHCVPIKKMCEVAKDVRFGDTKAMILFETPQDALAAIEGGVEIKTLNVGSMAHSQGKFAVNKVLSLDAKDIETFEKLKEHGVEFDVRKVPSDSKENMDTLLQKAREGLGI